MINLLMCGNRAIKDGLILSMLSVAKHTSEAVHLYIATMDLSDIEDRFVPLAQSDALLIEKILKGKNKNSTVTVVDMTDAYRSVLMGGKNEKSRYTPYAMIRLLADLYPLPDKILYLDTDVLACSDINELYSIDVNGYHIAGVKDHYGRWFISPKYMNSGVMLWNLGAMRNDGILKKCRELCYRKKMLLPDQSALNKYARIKYLPSKFNDQHKLDEKTVLQHFSMRIRWIPFRTENIKPWNVEALHEKMNIHHYDDIIAEWQRIKKEESAITVS